MSGANHFIWKVPLPVTNDGIGNVHVDGRIVKVLSAGLDPEGTMCVWVLVNAAGRPGTLAYQVLGTGWPISDDQVRSDGVLDGAPPLPFVGTVSGVEGSFVLHVFAAAFPA